MIEAPRKRRGRPRKNPQPETQEAAGQPQKPADDPRCIGNDPLCPCQDGDACHYRDHGKTKAMPANVDEMNRAQMLRYAEQLGMRRPDPAIADGILRANILHFLHQRIEDAMEVDA